MAGISLRRAHADDAHRQPDLPPQQGRLSDALQEGSDAAQSAIFPDRGTMTTQGSDNTYEISNMEGTPMLHRALIATAALAAALALPLAAAQAFDESKYPDWGGAWHRIPIPGVTGQPGYDPTKRLGRAQQAPLTPEATAIMEASIADQAKGGQGNYPTYTCLSPGMPRIMTPYGSVEFVVTPDTIHVFIEHVHDSRRIYTDGRDWPSSITPTLQGYSIGKWLDTDGDGRYDTLEVETRGMRGPRAFDASGMPMFSDPDSRVLERI